MAEPARTFESALIDHWPITDEVKQHLQVEFPGKTIVYGKEDAAANGLAGYTTSYMAWAPPDGDPFDGSTVTPEGFPVIAQMVVRTRMMVRYRFAGKNKMFVYMVRPVQVHVPYVVSEVEKVVDTIVDSK